MTRLLEFAGVVLLFAAMTIVYMYAKLQAAERRRKLASHFEQERTKFDSSSEAAVNALANLYIPRRKK